MHLAAQLNDPAYLASLLRHGGNPNALNVYGRRTIIHEAIMLGRIDNVRLLVEAGADIDAQADVSLATPLLKAVAVNEYEIAHYLLEQGADPTLEYAWTLRSWTGSKCTRSPVLGTARCTIGT